MRTHLRAKVKGTITGTDLYYEGSLTLGEEYFDVGAFQEGEQVDILNVNNGQRLTTYVIKGEGKDIILNGASARMGMIGDKVIILAYEIS